jgi:hypothetical protein
VSLPIGGVWFFGFTVGGCDFGVKLKISFRAIDFVDGTDILLLQESSGPGAVLARYVLLLPASFGLEFQVPMLGSSSSSVDWNWSWRRLAFDTGLRDDVVGAFIVVWFGSLVVVLLLAIYKGDVALSVGVSTLSFLIGFLLCC